MISRIPVLSALTRGRGRRSRIFLFFPIEAGSFIYIALGGIYRKLC